MPLKQSALFSWLNVWRPEELEGVLEQIYIASEAGQTMRAIGEVACIAGGGLDGDRYAAGRGHWIRTDGCQVTLIAAEDIVRAQRRGGMPFDNGEHRRNLVVSGIPLAAYRNHRLTIGDVPFAFHRLRPPCGYLDRLLRPGAGKALGKGAGIGLKVLENGVIRVGDPVRVLADPPDTKKLD